jgi:hypothetical protein
MKVERAWLIAAALGLVAVQFIGCGDPTSQTPTSSSSGSSGDAGAAGAGGNGSGGAGGSSSSGMPPECTTAADCMNNGPTNFCGEPECANGKCGRKGLQPPGTVLPSQLYGDCDEQRCDETFNIKSYSVDDPYDDGNSCTDDKCTDGVLTHMIKENALCDNLGSTGICASTGACVPCIDGVQDCIAPKTCSMNRCIGPNCMNGSQDAGESDIDCGAPNSQCPPCADNKACTNNSQCASGVCVTNKCALPSCMDIAQNGSETGFNCGGPDCSKCPTGEGCITPNDCQSGVCKAGICQAPTCMDSRQNGDESGPDCGGSCKTPCP